jgi:hypothetical protein
MKAFRPFVPGPGRRPSGRKQGRSKFLTLVSTLGLISALFACSPPTVPSQTSVNNTYTRLGRFSLQGSTQSGKVVTSGGNTYITNVPFVKQGQDNTCGQAVATMVLQYWGKNIDYQTVVNESNPLNLGTSFDALQNYLRSKGLYAQGYRDGSLELIIELIKRGRPVIALLDFGGLNWEHYVLVDGYNSSRNTIIFQESNSGPYRELDANTFYTRWANPSLVNLPIFGGQSYQRLMFDVGTTPAVTVTDSTDTPTNATPSAAPSTTPANSSP